MGASPFAAYRAANGLSRITVPRQEELIHLTHKADLSISERIMHTRKEMDLRTAIATAIFSAQRALAQGQPGQANAYLNLALIWTGERADKIAQAIARSSNVRIECTNRQSATGPKVSVEATLDRLLVEMNAGLQDGGSIQ